mgnify:FL=1
MVALFLATTITCSQAISILNRIESYNGLSRAVKNDLIETILKTVPSCPVKVKDDEK